MKNKYFRGCGKIFGFTFRHAVSAKSFIILTVIVAILLFGIVFSVTVFPNISSNRKNAESPEPPANVFICDKTGVFSDTSRLKSADGLYVNVKYTSCDTVEKAQSETKAQDLVLVTEKKDGAYSLYILRPDKSSLSDISSAAFGEYAKNMLRSILIMQSGIDGQVLNDNISISSTVENGSEEQTPADTPDSVKEIASMMVSFATIFIVYMMVIFYGQLVASNIILEKNSKLMDFFLISVNPVSMLLGKVLSCASAAVMQMSIWILSACGGWWVGKITLRSVITGFEDTANIFAELGGFFTPAGIVMAILIIIAGFLLYCALAAIGGALASKPEDLSSTNAYFSIILIASFFLSLYASNTSGDLVSRADWLIYFPFTSILVAPGRALAGNLSAVQGIISMLIILVSGFLLIMLAGKIYKMMSFYRGNPPKLTAVFSMLRKDKSKKSDIK